MKLTLLGTGTSHGVPLLGCDCEVCRSRNPKDKRMRTAALLETESTRVLIDCGPDIRMQLMNVPFRKIDAVLLSHIHYDHVAGIDDLRPYCLFGDIDIYAERAVVVGLNGSTIQRQSYEKEHSSAASEYACLAGVKTLVVNALRWEKPHHSHQLIADAISFARELDVKRTLLVHVTHHIGLQKEANERLPVGFEFGYDGQVIEV